MFEAQRSVTYADGLDDEIMSCGSDTEVDEFEMPDDGDSANCIKALKKLQLEEPEAVAERWRQHRWPCAASCEAFPRPDMEDHKVGFAPEHDRKATER